MNYELYLAKSNVVVICNCDLHCCVVDEENFGENSLQRESTRPNKMPA
jgi:hypothetical protein